MTKIKTSDNRSQVETSETVLAIENTIYNSPNAIKLQAWYLTQKAQPLDIELINMKTGKLKLTELAKATNISYSQLKTQRPPNANMELQGLLKLVNKAFQDSGLAPKSDVFVTEKEETKDNATELTMTEQKLRRANQKIARLEQKLAEANAQLQSQEKTHSCLIEYREVLAEIGIQPE